MAAVPGHHARAHSEEILSGSEPATADLWQGQGQAEGPGQAGDSAQARNLEFKKTLQARLLQRTLLNDQNWRYASSVVYAVTLGTFNLDDFTPDAFGSKVHEMITLITFVLSGGWGLTPTVRE